MRINVNYKELKGALQVIGKAKIAGDVTADSYLYMDATQDGASIEGVGENMFYVKVHLAATIDAVGFATIRYVELKKFVDGVKGYKGEVTIEANEGDSCVKDEVIVKIGAISQAFRGFDCNYECRMPQMVSYQYVGGNDLVAKIAKATKFVDEKQTKPALQGVAIDARGEDIKVVSTDTKSLYIGEVAKSNIDGFETFNGFVSTQKRFWELLAKLASSDEVAVMFSNDYMYAGTATIELMAKCFLDTFCEYKMVVPREFECKTTIVNGQSLADTLKIFDYKVRLNFADHKGIGISGVDEKKSAYIDNVLTGGFELGEIAETKDGVVEKREGILHDEVAVNKKHIVDAIEVLGDLTITLNGNKPMHLQSKQNNDCVIVMPILV